MKLYKRTMACLLAGMMLAGTLGSCSGDSGTNSSSSDGAQNSAADSSETVEVWSFLTQEEMNYYADAYKDITGKTVHPTIFPGDQYMTKLQTAFRTGTNAPDVAYLEISQLGQFKETGMLEDLSSYGGSEIADNQIPYVADLSMNSKGEISGLSWQSTPGGFWYKKALAKEYLGTDDPEELSQITSSWDSIIEAGKSVYEKSGGQVAFFSDVGDVGAVLTNTKGMPWVDEEGNLVSDEVLTQSYELIKEIRDNNVDAKLNSSSPAFAAGLYETDPFIFFASATWALHYTIKANTPDDQYENCEDKWGFVPGPAAFQSGGTWLGMYSGSENKEAAWDYIKTMTSDMTWFDDYVVDDLGDFPGYIPAIESAIERDHRDSFTGDQDTFQYFYDTAMNVENDGMTEYDSTAGNLFNAARDLMLDGSLTVEQTVERFKADMKTAFPEIK